jgi:RhtB (resistance to homoserine/threonine) family protein
VLHVPLFLGISALVILIPGPDTAMVTKNALLHGRPAALGTAFGVCTGLTVWTVASAVGVASIVRTSATAFTVLKTVGAVYLVWLGIQALRAAHRAGAAGEDAGVRPRRIQGAPAGFRQGLFSNLANPKIAVFFMSLVPQFIGSRHPLVPFLGLGSIFVLMTLAYLSGYAVVAVRAAAQLQRPRVKAAIDRVTGVVLIGLGIRIALEHR